MANNVNIQDAQSMISQYAEYQDVKSKAANGDTEAIEDLKSYSNGANGDVIFQIGDSTYNLDTVENLMTEFLNIQDWDGVEFDKTDDGYSFTYKDGGKTYTEDMDFTSDTIEITSTNNINGSVKKSKIANGVEGYNDLVKYYDGDNDGDIDVTKVISIDNETNNTPNKNITTAAYKQNETYDNVIETYDSKGRRKATLNKNSDTAKNLWSHLGEQLKNVKGQTES